MVRFDGTLCPMRRSYDVQLDRALGGQVRALGRLISAIEDRVPEALEAVAALGADATRGAHVLAVTGPPGAGKSTLIERLITRHRERGERVAVLLVDPSSPRGGGALLGDRLRMQNHATDTGVFIRSLGNRGHLGGVTRTTGEVLWLLEAGPFEQVIVETVGVGQSGLEVRELADTVLVVLVPEGGDGIQAMKAGLLEIADILAVNKADRPDAHRFARQLQEVGVPVLCLSAIEDQGVDELVAHLHALRGQSSGERRGQEPTRRFVTLLLAEIGARIEAGIQDGTTAVFHGILADLRAQRVSPRGAAARVLDTPGLLEELLSNVKESGR